jgi:2'-5' RNA ligase
VSRLFIAINLPADLRQAAWDAAAPLRRADLPIRWVAPDALHLTLKFLGDVTTDVESQVVAAMEEAVQGCRSFTLPVGGFGAFPSADRPRVVWVGCEGVPALELLQHRLEQRVEPLGFPGEARPFRPHLTLGRVKERAALGGLSRLERILEPLQFEREATIDSIDLMESILGPDGARYSVRRAVSLAGR